MGGETDIRLTRRHQKIKDAAAFEVLNANSHYRVIWGILGSPHLVFPQICRGISCRQTWIQSSLTVLYNEQGKIIKSLKAGEFNLDASIAPGLAMLNTKYILIPGADQPLEFQGALGPAWFVDDITWVDSSEDELAGVQALDPSRTALVNAEFKEVLGVVSSPGNARASLVNYHPEGSTYEVNSDKGGLLCLSEVFYPLGWVATIDGKEAPIVRVNALLMALKVPSGKHEVELHFEPEGWGMSRGLSRAGSLLWVSLLSFCAWRHRRERD